MNVEAVISFSRFFGDLQVIAGGDEEWGAFSDPTVSKTPTQRILMSLQTMSSLTLPLLHPGVLPESEILASSLGRL